jgi:uncharacterized protein (DUF2267 family)
MPREQTRRLAGTAARPMAVSISYEGDQFIVRVQHAAEIGRDKAELAIRTVLGTLAERLDSGDARDLAARLPPEIAPWLDSSGPAERFDLDAFVRRVMEREDVDAETAEGYIRAVFLALERTVGDKGLAHVCSELSKDYPPLFPRGPHVKILSAERFLQRVADRAGVVPEVARRATHAVLETLAERISGGEIDDLVERLPPALHEPLQRGRERSGEKAQKMAPDEFVRRVAEREGIDLDDARDHTRAVMHTLREAVGDDELFDVAVQLPHAWVDELVR